jgi:hypothetical protein
MKTIILLALTVSAALTCPSDSTSFCVMYGGKVQNIWSNSCLLKDMPNVTVLHQGLCNTVPNAQ